MLPSFKKEYRLIFFFFLIIGVVFLPIHITHAGWFDDFLDDIGDLFDEVASFFAAAIAPIVPPLNSVLCFFGIDTTVGYFEGCGDDRGGGGGTSAASEAANAPGHGQPRTCAEGYKICGTTSCIPASGVCCANVGYPNRYCANGQSCTQDGQCQVGGSSVRCSELEGQTCTTVANSCGMTEINRYSCDGSCITSAPADSRCAVPTITLTTSPRLVNYRTPCTISWDLKDITSCSLTGEGVNVTVNKTNLTGSVQTPPLEATSRYVMNCRNGTVVSAEKTVTCSLNPRFQEN